MVSLSARTRGLMPSRLLLSRLRPRPLPWSGNRGRRRLDVGQAVVEFALIVPLLALLVLGAVDFGRIFYIYEALANGAREGARYCAIHDTLAPAQRLAASRDAATRVRVEAELAPWITPDSGTACDYQGPGNPATVTVQFTFTPVTPFMARIISSSCTPLPPPQPANPIMRQLASCSPSTVTIIASATMVGW